MSRPTMSEKRDYYEVLEVSRTATADEIRKSYRRLARIHHPDISKEDDADTRFKEINEAYEVLSDQQRRAQYDRFGHVDPSMGGGGFGGDPFGGGSPFGDIFDTFFGASNGSGRRRQAVQRGQDLEVTVRLSFEEAVFGVEKTVELTRSETCEVCDGKRQKDGQDPPSCGNCGGSGEVRQVQQTILGQFMTAGPCPVCHGDGVQITDPCTNCKGRGRVTRARSIAVDIPAGIDESATLRMSGQGEAGPVGGIPGNLYVKVRIAPHPLFTRQGKTINSQLGINVAQAALGDEIEIDTIDGPVSLRIPAGTQSGQQFRLRGKGVPDMRGGDRGDQIVTVQALIPKDLSEEQQELFERLAESLGSDITQQPQHRGFFDKMKDALGV
ncbi:MAG TPA: molecular chaperone DnaJ [Thermomicrobiales bacterium]|nr:molecular chaperone DnaJ [Thermomicrobiales bacterium]